MFTAVPAVALVLALAGAPAAPQLSIAVDSPQASVVQGDHLTFTVTVRNLGSAGVKGLRVTQTVPSGMHLDSSTPSGSAEKTGVGWTVTLKPSAQAVFHTSMSLTQLPRDQQRVATVVCASMKAAGPPLVCASHSAQLPSAVGGSSWWSSNWWWVVVLAVLVVVVAVGLVLRARASAARSMEMPGVGSV